MYVYTYIHTYSMKVSDRGGLDNPVMTVYSIHMSTECTTPHITSPTYLNV